MVGWCVIIGGLEVEIAVCSAMVVDLNCRLHVTTASRTEDPMSAEAKLSSPGARRMMSILRAFNLSTTSCWRKVSQLWRWEAKFKSSKVGCMPC